jgi:hypothetical protein
LLVFPQTLGQYRDDVEKSHIFSLYEDNLTTYNLMGFIGRNSSQLTISSRFGKSTQIDPLNPNETDPPFPFQIDPLFPAEIDPLKNG